MKKSDFGPVQITELMGDGIGPELAESIHAVAESLPIDFNFRQVDWSLANPAAVILAFGMLLDHVNRYDLGHALRLSLLGCIENGHSTRDLGGKLNTDEFTKIVIDNIPAHLPG